MKTYPIHNIWTGKIYLKLENFEFLCGNCEGRGAFKFPSSSKYSGIMEVCMLCNGSGKTDWITKLRKHDNKFHHPKNQIRGSLNGRA